MADVSNGPVWAIGLMTGTVLDGMIDIALLKTDGETVAEFGPWTLAPYPAGTQALLSRALEAALPWRFEGAEPAVFAEAEAALTRDQSAAIIQFLAEHSIPASSVGVIGFHGQTVLHHPPRQTSSQTGSGPTVGRTRQLGDGAAMAALTGIDVVHDFRTADVAAGGQGAPLSSAYHAALLRQLEAAGDVAVLNLGGVANITWCSPAGEVIGFDTGPANAPLNDWMERATGARMDEEGAVAQRGRVDEARLAALLEHPYLSARYPKSLDRYDFAASMVDGLGLEDGAATLTAFTAASVGRGLDLLPRRPGRIVVCGGGRKNPAIMAALRSRAGVEPVPAEAVGWRGDAIEAECFALLAVRALRGLPLSYPTTTGVRTAMRGGQISRAAQGG